AGPVDAGFGRPPLDGTAARAPSRGLRGLRRVRRSRAPPPGGIAHAASHSLLGVARTPLGRSGIPHRVPMVQYAPLLAGPDPGASRAGGRAPGAAPGARIASGYTSGYTPGRFGRKLPAGTPLQCEQ